MNKIEEYREHAHQCRVLAGRATSAAHRHMLLSMAATWDSLAVNREANQVRRKRIADLANPIVGER
jgi:hypothetical protein